MSATNYGLLPVEGMALTKKEVTFALSQSRQLSRWVFTVQGEDKKGVMQPICSACRFQ